MGTFTDELSRLTDEGGDEEKDPLKDLDTYVELALEILNTLLIDGSMSAQEVSAWSQILVGYRDTILTTEEGTPSAQEMVEFIKTMPLYEYISIPPSQRTLKISLEKKEAKQIGAAIDVQFKLAQASRTRFFNNIKQGKTPAEQAAIDGMQFGATPEDRANSAIQYDNMREMRELNIMSRARQVDKIAGQVATFEKREQELAGIGLQIREEEREEAIRRGDERSSIYRDPIPSIESGAFPYLEGFSPAVEQFGRGQLRNLQREFTEEMGDTVRQQWWKSIQELKYAPVLGGDITESAQFQQIAEELTISPRQLIATADRFERLPQSEEFMNLTSTQRGQLQSVSQEIGALGTAQGKQIERNRRLVETRKDPFVSWLEGQDLQSQYENQPPWMRGYYSGRLAPPARTVGR